MALGLLMPLTPLAGTLLVGYITVGSIGGSLYGFNSGVAGSPVFGSVSGPASADLYSFYWTPGQGGDVFFSGSGRVGWHFSFNGVTVQLVSYGGDSYSDFSSAQVSGWPTSGTHPFYVELP